MMIINNGTAKIEIMTSDVESDMSSSTPVDEGPFKDTSLGVMGISTEGREGALKEAGDSPRIKAREILKTPYI